MVTRSKVTPVTRSGFDVFPWVARSVYGRSFREGRPEYIRIRRARALSRGSGPSRRRRDRAKEVISSKSLAGLDEMAGVVRQGPLPASDVQVLLDGVVWRATNDFST
ncbi:hypothetical protein GCM10010464_76650 [Pseudonocardia yunnanensis]